MVRPVPCVGPAIRKGRRAAPAVPLRQGRRRRPAGRRRPLRHPLDPHPAGAPRRPARRGPSRRDERRPAHPSPRPHRCHTGPGDRGGGGLMAILEPQPMLGADRAPEEYPHAARVLIALVLGFFAPKVETALSGAGWETTGSQSVQARQLINKDFQGLSSYALMTVVYSPTRTVNDPAFKRVLANVERSLRSDGAVRSVVAPAPGISISRDGHTAIVQAGAARSSNGMVKAADSIKVQLAKLSTSGVQVHLTGASGMWSDFNAANRSAMLKSEVISWPVTLGILLLAFGSLVAAGLPLMLTMVGLASAAGMLYLGTQITP